MGLSQDSDPAFLHGLKQGGLGLGRGPVDLVGEDNVGEEWAGLEDELALAVHFLKDGIPRDISRQEVGSELDALGIQMEDPGETLDEFGFPEAGKTFEKNVATRKNSGEDQLDEFLLTEENLVQGIGEGPDVLAGIGDFGFRGVLHGIRGR